MFIAMICRKQMQSITKEKCNPVAKQTKIVVGGFTEEEKGEQRWLVANQPVKGYAPLLVIREVQNKTSKLHFNPQIT